MNVVHVIGTRPDVMRAAAVWHAGVGRVDQRMYVLDQQTDSVMVEANLHEVGIDRTKIVGVHARTPDLPRHAWPARVASVLTDRLALTYGGFVADTIVLVYGGSDAAVAGAIAANRLGLRVAHVGAGLRSMDRTMPEEGNRIVVDMLSSVHFGTEPAAMKNLLHEGYVGEFVGNPLAQTLLRMVGETARRRAPLAGRYVLVTLHRPTNVDDPFTLQRMLAAIGNLHSHVHVVWVLHPRTKDMLRAVNVQPYETMMMVEPMPYGDFVQYLRFATVVVTDSGGVQEEATVLNVPCITIRAATEHPITLTDGTNRLMPLPDSASISALATVVRSILARADDGVKQPAKLPLYWDDRVGERIVDSLLDVESEFIERLATG